MIEPFDAEMQQYERYWPPGQPVRSVIVVDVERISDSCGFGVPLYDFRGTRSQYAEWADKKGQAALLEYQDTRMRRASMG